MQAFRSKGILPSQSSVVQEWYGGFEKQRKLFVNRVRAVRGMPRLGRMRSLNGAEFCFGSQALFRAVITLMTALFLNRIGYEKIYQTQITQLHHWSDDVFIFDGDATCAIDYASSAFTPGRTLPSKYSSSAPPPVDT